GPGFRAIWRLASSVSTNREASARVSGVRFPGSGTRIGPSAPGLGSGTGIHLDSRVEDRDRLGVSFRFFIGISFRFFIGGTPRRAPNSDRANPILLLSHGDGHCADRTTSTHVHLASRAPSGLVLAVVK